MIIDIIIISYNTQTLLLNCLNTLHHVPQGVDIGKIIVVDNASNDLTVDNVRATFPNVQVIALQENVGYASAVNIGFKETSCEWVFIGNADIEFRPNTLISLFNGMKGFSSVGICCPQQVYPDNSRQRSWGFFPGISEAIHYVTFTSAIENILESISMKLGIRRSSRFIPYADGAALLIESQAFRNIGGFDSDFFFFGEEELAERIKEYKRIYPKLKLIKKCNPSFLDNLIRTINPVNSNQYIEVWKTNDPISKE